MSYAGVYLYQVETSKLANGLIDGEVFLVAPNGYAYPKDMHGYGYASIGTLQFTPLTFLVVDANADYSIGTLTFVPPSADIAQGDIGIITISTIDGTGQEIAFANAELNTINVTPLDGGALIAKYIPVGIVTIQEPIVTAELTNDSGYQLSNSLYYDGTGKTLGSANTIDVQRVVTYTSLSYPSNTKVTFSTWFKSGIDAQTGTFFQSGYDSGLGFYWELYRLGLFSGQVHFVSGSTQQAWEGRIYDQSAWYHLVLCIDTTETLEENRCRLYINGKRKTRTDNLGGGLTLNGYNMLTMSGSINPSSNTGVIQVVGRSISTVHNYAFNGLMADTRLVTGYALSPDNFGRWDDSTSTWIPKEYSGPTPGVKSFHLPYTNASNLGQDSLGNGDFAVTPSAPNNNLISASGVPLAKTSPRTFQFNDSPSIANTNPVLGNYAKLDDNQYLTDNFYEPTIYDGGLAAICGIANTTNSAVFSTYAVSEGQWYWEVRPWGHLYDPHYMVGVVDIDSPGASMTYHYPNGWWYQGNTGEKWNNAANSSYGSTYTLGDTIGVALDMDAGTVTFYKNGISQGVAFSGLSGKKIAAGVASYRQQVTLTANFGQYPFDYTPPSGHRVLCSTNLKTPNIKNPTDHAELVSYIGTGNTQTVYSTSVSGYLNRTDWQPDLILLKSLDNSSSINSAMMIYDTIRGANNELNLGYNVNSSIEVVDSNSISSFIGGPTDYNAPGFTIGGNNLNINRNVPASLDYWGWMFNKSAGAGLDIVSYTGTGTTQHVNHELESSPEIVIIKDRDGNSPWVMWHYEATKKFANTVLYLNVLGSDFGNTSYFNSTSPTTSQFTVGGHPYTNKVGHRYIAYLFKSIPGFSKFGYFRGTTDSSRDPEGYTSSGRTSFVYTEFSPKSVWIIPYTYPFSPAYYDLLTYPFAYPTGENALMYDGSALINNVPIRNPANQMPITSYLYMNSYTEQRTSGSNMYYMSHGFLASYNNFLYFAWADASSKYARARE